MARVDVLHHSLAVGIFDADKLHRVDVERSRLAAERQTNLMPDSIGKGTFRAGFEYKGQLAGKARPIPFAVGTNSGAALCMSNLLMEVYDKTADAMVTRVSVATAITSGDFSASTGWTLSTDAGQSTAISGGKLTMSARAHGAKAKASASASVAGGDQAKEHALRIVVDRGPVVFRLGSTSGGDELIGSTELRKGVHSLSFTPGVGTIYLQFSTERQTNVIVDSCTIEAAGRMQIATPWPTSAIQLLRSEQSLDVLFVACRGYKEQRIEMRNNGRSWSVCDYDRDDGPFQSGRSAEVTLTPGALEGNTTLTASSAFFKAAHVGALFRLFHEGQSIDTYLAGANAETPAFLVTGITETNFEERKHTATISGTWAGTLRNRRAFGDEFGQYVDFRRAQSVATIDITANASYTNDDNDDNIDVWVKMVMAAYTSGEARVQYSYPGGGGYGICRVVGYTSATQVDIEIIRPFKGLTATKEWRQSRYDGVSGYPSTVSFVDGRLSWAGNDLFDASVSDAYSSFDETFEGEAGPLSRSIALGGRNDVHWSLSLSSLMLGCGSRIANVRASSLDEILTPDNFGMKSSAKIGAAPISPVELADDRAIYVQASGRQLYELTWSSEKARYVAAPFSKLTTKLFSSGIQDIAVQVLPDQRMWVACTDADAIAIVFEPTQQVLGAHVKISTSSDTDFFEYFCVLPGDEQDRVFAVIRRVVNGSTVYYFERQALETEALVDVVSKVMDSHVTFGAGSATITGLSHLEGRSVVVWMDGAPVLDSTVTTQGQDNVKYFVVSGGQITLDSVPESGGCVGLPYAWEYKSSRLAYGVEGYTPMLRNKSLSAVGLLLSDYVRDGIMFGAVRGSNFATPYNLPKIANGQLAAAVVMGDDEDEHPFAAGGNLDLDARLCMSGASPKPCTIRSIVLGVQV